MTTRTDILARLHEQFGPNKHVLSAGELAIVMEKSVKTIYNLKSKGALPVPVLVMNGRPCVSIHAVADWLAGGPIQQEVPDTEAPEAPAEDDGAKPRKARKLSMADMLATLRGQMDFLGELHSEIERIEIENEAKEAADAERDTL